MSIEVRSEQKRRLRRKGPDRRAMRRPTAERRRAAAPAAAPDRVPRWAQLLALLGLALLVAALFDMRTEPDRELATAPAAQTGTPPAPVPAAPAERASGAPAAATDVADEPLATAPAPAAADGSEGPAALVEAEAPSPYQMALRQSPLAEDARDELARRVAASGEQRAAQARTVWRYDDSLRAMGTLVTPPAAAFSLHDMTAPQAAALQEAFDGTTPGASQPAPAFSRAGPDPAEASPEIALSQPLPAAGEDRSASETPSLAFETSVADDAPRTVLGIRDFGIVATEEAAETGLAAVQPAPLPRPRPDLDVAAIALGPTPAPAALPRPDPRLAAVDLAIDLPRPRPELAPTISAFAEIATLDAPPVPAMPMPRARPVVPVALALSDLPVALPRPRPIVPAVQMAEAAPTALPRPRPEMTIATIAGAESAGEDAAVATEAAIVVATPRPRPATVPVALAVAPQVAPAQAAQRPEPAASPPPRALAARAPEGATGRPIALWTPGLGERAPQMTQTAQRGGSARPAPAGPAALAYAAMPEASVALPEALAAITGPDALEIAVPGGVTLPGTLLPTGAGGTGTAIPLDRAPVTAAALPYAHGVPRHMVDACLSTLQAATQRYGALRVHARSGGALQVLNDGGRLAPLTVRVVYALPGGGFEARSARLSCRMATGGAVSGLG